MRLVQEKNILWVVDWVECILVIALFLPSVFCVFLFPSLIFLCINIHLFPLSLSRFYLFLFSHDLFIYMFIASISRSLYLFLYLFSIFDIYLSLNLSREISLFILLSFFLSLNLLISPSSVFSLSLLHSFLCSFSFFPLFSSTGDFTRITNSDPWGLWRACAWELFISPVFPLRWCATWSHLRSYLLHYQVT